MTWLEWTGFVKSAGKATCIEEGCDNPGRYMISLCGDERWACYKHYEKYILIMEVTISAHKYIKQQHFYKDRIGIFGYLPRPGARTISGVTYGPKELAFVKDLGNNYEIWKSFGHTAWSGIGQTSYYQASYMLVKVEDNLVSVLVDVTPGHNWRMGIKFLEEYYGVVIASPS